MTGCAVESVKRVEFQGSSIRTMCVHDTVAVRGLNRTSKLIRLVIAALSVTPSAMPSTFTVVSSRKPDREYPDFDFSGPLEEGICKVMTLVHNHDDSVMLEFDTRVHESNDCVRLEVKRKGTRQCVFLGMAFKTCDCLVRHSLQEFSDRSGLPRLLTMNCLVKIDQPQLRGPPGGSKVPFFFSGGTRARE